ncbi:hypothetical protein ACKLNR_007769 [Fusarium oxysporum f. sp. zingiberi]|nr:hypothetical protein H9L39_00527 [Fusarium oxysporum f. sp. albedinis]
MFAWLLTYGLVLDCNFHECSEAELVRIGSGCRLPQLHYGGPPAASVSLASERGFFSNKSHTKVWRLVEPGEIPF